MKKIIALSAAAMLAVVAGCGSSNKPSVTGSSLGPDPRPMPPPSGLSAPATADPLAGGYGPAATVDPAPVAPTATAAGAKYTVKKGDTLWSIASRTYGDGKQYKKIVSANPTIKGDKIAVGQTIILP